MYTVAKTRVLNYVPLVGREKLNITRNMGQDGRNYANYNSLWRPNPTIKYIRVNKNIKFSPTLRKYFAVSEFDISSGIYEQYLYKHW